MGLSENQISDRGSLTEIFNKKGRAISEPCLLFSYETVEKPANSEADGKCPSRRLCCGTKSRGITAKERYLREAYVEVRCSGEGRG